MLLSFLTTLFQPALRIIRPAVLAFLAMAQLLQPAPLDSAAQSLGIALAEDAQILHWSDSHGGFHGDGIMYTEIDTNGEFDPQDAGWNKLPLSEDMQTIFYGTSETIGDMEYSRASCLPEGVSVPEVTNGWWQLFDWQGADGSSVFDESRASLNFTAALYDADTGILYYLDLDT